MQDANIVLLGGTLTSEPVELANGSTGLMIRNTPKVGNGGTFPVATHGVTAKAALQRLHEGMVIRVLGYIEQIEMKDGRKETIVTAEKIEIEK